MGNDKTIKLTLDIQTKVGNLEKEVSNLQKTFNSLKGPTNLTKDIKDSFSDLESRLKKVKEYTDNNEINIVDEKKVKSELDNIAKEYTKLFKSIDRNSEKFSLASASKEGKALKDAISAYKTQIEDSTKSIKAQESEIDKLNKKIEEANSKLAVKGQVKEEAQARVDALKEQEEALQRIIDLKKEEQKNNGRSENQNRAALERTKAYQQQQKVQEELAVAEKELVNANKDYERQEKSTSSTIKATNIELENQRAKLADLNANFEKLSVEKFNDLKNTLRDLQQGGFNFGFDVEQIENVQQLETELNKIENTDNSRIQELVNLLLNGFSAGKKEAEDYNKEIDQSAESQKQLNNELEQFKSRVTYFFGMNNAVRLFQRAVRSAFNTVQDLDKVMTETAVVTNFSVGDMWSQLPEYTKRANELGVSIHDAYEAATLYYQQGLKTNEVMAVSNETLKMARIAGLDAADATDRMTNALRGFNMEITEANAKNINDVYSNLAAKTASNVDEISTAMTKVASLASNANMSFENTAAFLSQIIETTRESAETAGTALKTVIARFSEVKSLYSKGELLGDLEGEEIDVNKISTALRTAGINLNEYLTGMKGLDEIFMELSAKWSSLDQIQQRYIATMAAGSRQQSRFIALMQNNARMTELVSDANKAAGASQKQFEKTLESLETKLNQLHNAWNTFLMGIANSDAIKFAVDLLTNVVELLNKMTGQLPGLLGSITQIITVVMGFKLGKALFTNVFRNIGATLRGQATTSGAEAANAWVTSFKARLDQSEHGIKGTFQALFGKLDKEGQKLTANLQSIGTAAAVAGGAISMLAQFFDDGSEGGKQFSQVLTYVGNGITIAGGALMALNAIGITTKAVFAEVFIAIAAIAAIAGGVIAICNAVYQNSPEAKLKAAEEAAQKAEQAADDAAKAYESLGNAFASLEEKEQTLEDLTEGTKEWKEKVHELNQEILDLKENFAGIRIVNNNGILSIENKDEVEAQYYRNKATSGNISAEADLEVAYRSVDKQISDLINNRKFGLGYYGRTGSGEYDYTTLNFAKVVSDEDIIKAARFAATMKEDDYRHILQENGIQAGATFGGNPHEYYQELRNLGEKIIQLDKDLEITEDNFFEEYRANVISGLRDNVNLNYANTTLSTNIISDNIKRAVTEGFGEITDANRAELRYEYARSQNFNTYEDWKKSNNDEEISDEKLKENLISIRATAKLIDKTAKITTKIAQSESEVAQRLFSSESGGGLTLNDLAEYKDNIPDLIAEIFGEIKDETEKRELTNIITSVFEKAQTSAEKLKDTFGNDVFQNVSIDSITKFSEQMKKIEAYSGEGGLDKFQDAFKTLVATMDEDSATQFAEALGSITWTDAGHIKDFANQLETMGIEIGTDSNAFKSFIETLEATAGAVESINFDKVLEQVDTLRDVLKDFDEDNRSFSKDSYNAIISADSSQAENFVKDTLTGEYVYIGESMDKLREAIEQNTLAQLGKSREQLEAQIRAGQIASGLGSINSIDDIYSFLKLAGKKGFDVGTLGLGISNTTTQDQIAGLSEETRQGIYTTLKNLVDNVITNGDLLEQIKEEESLEAYQKKNSSILAALAQTGDNLAQREIKRRAAQSGMSGSLFNDPKSSYAEITGLIDVFSQAGKRGLDLTAFNNLIEVFKEGHTELNNFQAALLVFNNELFNSGYKELFESFDEWSAEIDQATGLIKTNTTTSIESYSKLVDIVSKMLNITPELAKEFLKSADNVALLQEAAKGSTEAVEKLKELGSEIVIEPTVEMTSDELADLMNAVIDGADIEDIEINAKINTEMFYKQLNTMMEQAYMAGNDVAKLMSAAGIKNSTMSLYDYIISGKYKDVDKVTSTVAYKDNTVGAYNKTMKQELKSLQDLSTKLNLSAKQIAEVIADPNSYYANTLKSWTVVIEENTESQDRATRVYGDTSNSLIEAAKKANTSTTTTEEEVGPKYELWTQAYDEIFAWQLKINNQIRSRKRLEREYQDILRSTSSSADEIRKGYQGQVASLQQEAQLQRELLYLAENKAATLGKSYFLDSQGNYRTYAEMGVDKMISYDTATHMIGEPDWNRINKISDADTKAALHEYYDKMKELVNTAQSAEDAIYDIEDAMYDLQQQSIDSYVSFEERVMDALQKKYTKEIDELEKVNETLDDTSSNLIKSIQDQIAEQRRQRNNAKTEEGIADKEARLAYLSRDTSGANDLEVLKLQKEIEDARLNYEDQLIDQALDQMQKDADLAAEQRAEQIQLMRDQLQNQIDTGALWEEVYSLIGGAMEDGDLRNSDLIRLLEESEGYQTMSEFGKGTWFEKTAESFNTAIAGLYAGGAEWPGDPYNRTVAHIDPFLTGDQKSALLQEIEQMGFEGEKLIVVDEDSNNQLDTISKKMDTITNLIRENNGDNNPSGNDSGGSSTSFDWDAYNKYKNSLDTKYKDMTPDQYAAYLNPTTSQGTTNQDIEKNNQIIKDQTLAELNKWKVTRLFGKFDEDGEIKRDTITRRAYVGTLSEYLKSGQWYSNAYAWSSDYNMTPDTGRRIAGITDLKKYFGIDVAQLFGYANGGLADFTGPAWLDGSKTNPELVLNAADTKNFLALRDILAQLVDYNSNSSSNTSYGDTYYDIDINAEIGSDYDVDQLADRIKNQIAQDGQYRNVNAISFLR